MTPPVIEVIERQSCGPVRFTRPAGVFYRMKERLAAGDIPDAVHSINTELRDEVQQDLKHSQIPRSAQSEWGRSSMEQLV